MKRFHWTSGLVAFLALAAWANVQIMACCWSFSTPVKAMATVETVSGEHSCCHHRASAVSMPVSTVPDGASLISMAGSSCCNHYVTPALQTLGHSLYLALAADVQFSHETVHVSSYSLSATPVRNTGPPVFLAFQRLLI